MITEFLNAVAQSLRNLGLEATVEYNSILCGGIDFEVRQRSNRRSFQFCGRTYRTGNVLQAALDLLIRLPELQAERARWLAREQERRRVRDFNKKYKDFGISYDGSLHYKTSFETAEQIAEQLIAGETIQLTSVDNWLSAAGLTENVKFTAEGGFSLN